MISLGDKVKCKVTGFSGIATQRVENLNGCLQFTVSPPIDKDGKYSDRCCIDVENLEIVKAAAVKVDTRPGGGPMTRPARRM
jgi:hypothetical protein